MKSELCELQSNKMPDSDIRKDEILPFATTWMDLENIVLNEISQTEKVKSHII